MTRMGRRRRWFYSCNSCDLWATHLAPSMSGATSPIPLYLPAFSPVCSRCIAPFPHGMESNIEPFAGPKPETLPRGVGVLACRLPHRPGACLFPPKAQLVAPKPPSDGGSPEPKASQFIRLSPCLCASVVSILKPIRPISAYIRPYPPFSDHKKI